MVFLISSRSKLPHTATHGALVPWCEEDVRAQITVVAELFIVALKNCIIVVFSQFIPFFARPEFLHILNVVIHQSRDHI